MIWIIAFALGFAGDFIWAKSSENVARGNPLQAATWLLMFNICSFTCVYFIAERHFIPVLFYLTGAWIGTFIAVRFQKGKENVKEESQRYEGVVG